MITVSRRQALVMGAAMSAATLTARAATITPLKYLFPAPDFLPAFAPFQLAKSKGYYSAAGLDVSFLIGKGGADVAKQVAVGNADLGGGIGDTALIVRPNGLKIRGVALLGGQALNQIVVRKASGIKSFADLKGKKIGVISFADTSFYTLQGVMASVGLSKQDASIEAVGPAGVVQLMISGALDAICAVPEWTVAIENAHVPVTTFEIDAAFPAMAQAIIASDALIAKQPKVVAAFVGATLKSLSDIIADPKAAAAAYCAAVVQHKGQEALIETIMRRYIALVYKTNPPQVLGQFDPRRLAAVDAFYVSHHIASAAVPVADVYTNQFVKAG